MALLSEAEIVNRLNNYQGWNYSGDSIFKEFTRDNFADAVAFFVKIAFESEKADHHPDIKLHSWNKLTVTLSTHSEKGVTEKDFFLLTKIENIK